MTAWRKIKLGLDRTLETLVAVVMAVLVVDVVWQVFTRYVLRSASSWTEELATFLMIWVGLLGASVGLNRGAHLGIDYLVQKLPARRRLLTEVVVFACTGLFSLLALGVGGTTLVVRTLQLEQISPALGIRMGYVYLALPISGFFLTLYSAQFLAERLTALLRGTEAATPPPTAGEQREDAI
jgi:TRAP-type C4-dicarboxylate transport system permease small subunit